MQKKKTRKRGAVKAPSAPAKDKMVKTSTVKPMCDGCEEFYRRGFDKCLWCGRPRVSVSDRPRYG